nr:hypothetical protein [Tanacetum cinerariifolium]
FPLYIWLSAFADVAALSQRIEIDAIVDACHNAMKMWKAIERLKQASDEEVTQRDNEIEKLMALISMYFKKIYKPTDNNLKTSSNTRNKIVDNTSRYDRRTRYDRQTRQYENQRAVNVAKARDNVLLDVADNSGPIFDTEPLVKIQNNVDNYNVFSNEIQHPEQLESINDTYVMEKDDKIITPDSSNMTDNGREADQDDDLAK